jgi:hypothetical protein
VRSPFKSEPLPPLPPQPWAVSAGSAKTRNVSNETPFYQLLPSPKWEGGERGRGRGEGGSSVRAGKTNDADLFGNTAFGLPVGSHEAVSRLGTALALVLGAFPWISATKTRKVSNETPFYQLLPRPKWGGGSRW